SSVGIIDFLCLKLAEVIKQLENAERIVFGTELIKNTHEGPRCRVQIFSDMLLMRNRLIAHGVNHAKSNTEIWDALRAAYGNSEIPVPCVMISRCLDAI